MKKFFLYSLLVLVLCLLGGLIYFLSVAQLDPPVVKNTAAADLKAVQVDENFFRLNESWLRKSSSELWEMYVEAEDPYTRGCINGKLAQKLVQQQEVYFIRQIKKIIPSETYLNYLKYAIAWFNRNLDQFIDEEYKEEIYGVSAALGDEYDFIGSKYQRSLNYHAAHDIGHALQDKNMVVGCTSFSAWNSKSLDSDLIVGRNFDFYVGDEFAQDKIVCFYRPIKGNNFVYITWGGFIGAVSGMNDKGITVTINASKSDIPTGSATPISLVAREILQYASTIAEAKSIADKRKTFVSESILVASVADHRAVIIEKSPNKTELFTGEGDYLICANNFQSKAFEQDPANLENKKNSSSMYRHDRMNELIQSYPKIGPEEVASILRNRLGMGNRDIGLGNEKSINQLIAHHSVIMQPGKKLIWVSTQPFQLGQFKCYSLDSVFNKNSGLSQNREIALQAKSISADPFAASKAFANFKSYKILLHYLHRCTKNKQTVSEKMIQALLLANPENYEVQSSLGDYYFAFGHFDQAKKAYQTALSKEIALLKERTNLEEKVKQCDKAITDI